MTKITIPERLLDIGEAAIMYDWPEARAATGMVLSAVLPELAKMMMEPSDHCTLAGVAEVERAMAMNGNDAMRKAHRAMLRAFFKEMGVEV